MYTLTYTFAITLMILLPVLLAVWLRRRVQVPWILFCIGALTFIGSQLVHFPLNGWLERLGWLPAEAETHLPLWRTALVLGLTAGLSEELARALGYQLLKRFRKFEDGVMLGLGHGGIEAMIFGGVMTAASITALLSLRGTDLELLNLTDAQFTAVQMQLDLFLASPWRAFIPLLERGIAMAAHVMFSLLVWQAFARQNAWYVLAAIGYHAGVDYFVAYSALNGLLGDAPLLHEGIFAALLLPGWVWVWRIRPRGAASRLRPAPRLAGEWGAFMTALRKELLEQWRTKRLLVVAAVFLLFGLASPLLAKFTPEMLRMIEGAEQFADLIPEPTMADAMAQYVKNLTQFGFILAVLLGMGAIVGEKERGTAPMILSKPMPRWAFVLSKFTAQALVYGLAFVLAALGGYYYSWLLFGPLDFGEFALLNFLLWLWLLTFAGVTLVGSTLGKSTGGAAGLGLAGAVVLLVAGTLPVASQLAPGALVAWAGQLGAGADAVMPNGGALAMSAVLVLMSLIVSVALFERQEI